MGNKDNSWLWMLLPAGILGAIFIALWLKSCGSASRTNLTEAYTGGASDEIAEAHRAAEAAHIVTKTPVPAQRNTYYGAKARTAYSRQAGIVAGPAAPARKEMDQETAKQSRWFGLTCDAISNTVAKSMNTPKVIAAILNNDYVVKGFMSRATVQAATANKTALADYLKDPVNYEKFAGKPAVQLGINNPAVVDAVASSKLIDALLDTPAAAALMNDPQEITDILAANPALGSVLADPRIIGALANNPRTAGILSVR